MSDRIGECLVAIKSAHFEAVQARKDARKLRRVT